LGDFVEFHEHLHVPIQEKKKQTKFGQPHHFW